MFRGSCSTYNQILSKQVEGCASGSAPSFPRVQRSFASGEDRAADIIDALQLHNSLYISLSLVLPPSFLTSPPSLLVLLSPLFVLVDKRELGQTADPHCLLLLPPLLSHTESFFCVSCPAKYLLASTEGNRAALYCLSWFYNYSSFFFYLRYAEAGS